MPNTLITKTGDSIAAIASQIFNGDVTRFTELLDLNPDIDVFEELTEGLNVEIPDVSQVLNYAQPVLSQVGATINGATEAVNTISASLPDNLKGYTTEALKVLGEINGVLGEVESTLNKVGGQGASYGGEPVKLVKWLLDGRA